MNLAIVHAIRLEAIYQIIVKRGLRRGRPQFFIWVQEILRAMIEAGDLVVPEGR